MSKEKIRGLCEFGIILTYFITNMLQSLKTKLLINGKVKQYANIGREIYII
jgi:hypothetical protein